MKEKPQVWLSICVHIPSAKQTTTMWKVRQELTLSSQVPGRRLVTAHMPAGILSNPPAQPRHSPNLRCPPPLPLSVTKRLNSQREGDKRCVPLGEVHNLPASLLSPCPSKSTKWKSAGNYITLDTKYQKYQIEGCVGHSMSSNRVLMIKAQSRTWGKCWEIRERKEQNQNYLTSQLPS